MAAFDLSLKLGGNTVTLSKTASAGDETRFVAALRIAYPAAGDDTAAIQAWLLDHAYEAKQLTKRIERQVAAAANVETIGEIAIT